MNCSASPAPSTSPTSPRPAAPWSKGPYDIGLVEGSITTHHDAERIQEVRRQCHKLITIGACATAGGIQALRNWKDVDEFIRVVYATPQYISTLKLSTPIAEHVPVDFELRGCPINKHQLIELITATLAGRKPNVPTYSVCMECKRKRQRLHRGGAGSRLPGTGYPRGLRRALPELRSGLLRLLRPHGEPQHGIAQQPVPHSGPERRRDHARLPRLQCLGLAVPQGQRGERAIVSDATQPERSRSTLWPESKAKARSIVKLKGDQVQDVKLKIYEPPRFFEAFLRGRHFSEAPRHRGAHLRNLSDRVSDERGARHRECSRCRNRSIGPAAATAVLLRRVD